MSKYLDELSSTLDDEEEKKEEYPRVAGGLPLKLNRLAPAAIPEISTVAEHTAASNAILKSRSPAAATELANPDTLGIATTGKLKGEPAPYAVTKTTSARKHEGIHNLINQAVGGDAEKSHTLYNMANSKMDPSTYGLVEDYITSLGYKNTQVENEVIPHLSDLFSGKRSGERQGSFREYLETEGMTQDQANAVIRKAKQEYNKAARLLNSVTKEELEAAHAQRIAEESADFESLFKELREMGMSGSRVPPKKPVP